MPYTRSDYPNTMKNLKRVIRIKAIDILNAMLKEGYKEENAIPIAISQAKEWNKNAQQSEIEDLLNKDIRKHEENSDDARLQDADVKVSYDEEEEMWAVKSVGAKQVGSYHETKKEALDQAQTTADNRDSKVIKKDKKNS